MRLKGLLLLVGTVAAVAALWPAAGSAATFRGVVVARQHGSMLIASPAGVVRSITGHAALGSEIALTAHGATVVGHTRTAHIRGIVIRRIGTTLVLSSNRHLVAIRKARLLAGSAPIPTAPTTGAVVSTTVGIQNGQLDEESEDQVGQVSASSLQVQATVASVGTGTVTLNVQGQMITVPLPAGLTLPQTIVGQTVTLAVSLGDNQGGGDDQGENDNGDSAGGGNGGGGNGGGDTGGGDGGGDD
jgi:hypothetical protein